MEPRENALAYLEARHHRWIELAKDIWEHPELGLQEVRASRLLSDELEQAGFSVQCGVGPLPTAFIASWGEGKPVIGILGEYDALPGLSQKVSAAKEPFQEGAAGHGCGHNLFGVACLAAALAAKNAMEKSGLKGNLRYFGCPAEETMLGKPFMARAGVFDTVDAAITWHPGYANTVEWSSCLAMNSFKVSFHGVAAHAAAAPHEGRSALDAVELMDVGVNFLREHIPEKARIHCVITHGGQAPNVVPAYAQVWYLVRAPLREQVDEVYARMLEIAKGAALMTGTTYDVDFLTGGYDMLPNDRLGELLLEKLKEAGPPQFTADDKDLARRLQATLPAGAVEGYLRENGVTREMVGDPLCETIVDPFDRGKIFPASSDVGNVSHITPTAQINTCCHALGTPLHSWQMTAAAGSAIGFKGMIVAARTLALTALELATRPDIVRAARAEFDKTTAGKKYVSPLPEGAVPH
jgi:aminobenzoyl-glutamate utilization protein B